MKPETETKIVNLFLILVIGAIFVTLAMSCAVKPIPEGSTQPEPKTIIQGAEGQLGWGFTLDLGIIEPISIQIWGNRNHEPE